MSDYTTIQVTPYFADGEKYPNLIGVKAEGDKYETAYVKKSEMADAVDYWQRMYEGTARERTCRFVDDSDGEFPPKCSACGYDPSIYECTWLGDGGYEYEGNYCVNCGARVEGAGR